MKLYHGTSSKLVSTVMKAGLPAGSSVARDPAVARFWAKWKCGDVGGRAVILAVEIEEASLSADFNALNGPDDSVAHSSYRAEWERILANHPDWGTCDKPGVYWTSAFPRAAWRESLAICGAVVTDDPVPPSSIECLAD